MKPARYFPDVSNCDECGLLAFGGKLDPDWLIDAYTHGIFPWPVGNNRKYVRSDYSDSLRKTPAKRNPKTGAVEYDMHDPNDPAAWWSPDPRAVFEIERFHVSKRLERTIRSGKFEVTFDRSFREVMLGCALSQDRSKGTWITPLMVKAYVLLHELGTAHSVEAWFEGDLAGGVYGIAINGFFAAESMFYRETDASKVALVRLFEHLRQRGYLLVDTQMTTDHTERCGAIEIPREEYLHRLEIALNAPVQWSD